MSGDQIIEEVRENRKNLEEKWGGEFNKLHEHALEYQKKLEGRLVSKEELKKRESFLKK